MSGIMNKFWSAVGLGVPVDDDDFEQEELVAAPRVSSELKRASDRPNDDLPDTDIHNPAAARPQARMENRSKVIVYAPQSYSDLPELIAHLRGGCPTVVSFEGYEGRDVPQMLDFIFGAVCALDGSAQKLSERIFLFIFQETKLDSNLKETLLARDALLRKAEKLSAEQDFRAFKVM